MFWLLVALVFQLALSGRLQVYVDLLKVPAERAPTTPALTQEPRPDLP